MTQAPPPDDAEPTQDLPGQNPDYPWLTALPSVSILGDHGGVLDDDLFDLLESHLDSQ